MPQFFRAVPVCAGLVLFCASASAVDRLVPSQFATIQAAVDASSDGDVVIIQADTYTEQVVVTNLNITLMADVGKVVIDAANTGSALTVTGTGAELLIVEGIDFEGGSSTLATIEVATARLSMTDCVVSFSQSNGIHIDDADLSLTDCRVFLNSTNGISDEGLSQVVLNDTDVDNNTNFGMYIREDSSLTISGGSVASNGSDGIFFTSTGTTAGFDGCLITLNDGEGVRNAPDDADFTDCIVSFNDGYGVDGGFSFTGCEFNGNRLDGIGLFTNSVEVTDCTFIDNGSDGVRANSGTITNSTFINNGGAIDIGGTATISNCEVSGCSFTGIDVGLNSTITDCVIRNCGNDGISVSSSATIERCRIEFCGDEGINTFGSDPGDALTVRNCIIQGNDGIGIDAADVTYVHGCIIVGNQGGGINCVFEDYLEAVNCSIIANYTTGVAAGIEPADISYIRNSIVWGNRTDEGFDDRSQIDHFDDPIVERSCVEGGWEGVGNIDADPLFVSDLGSGLGQTLFDVRLMPGSPCTDAGDNALVPVDLTEDVFGCPRITDIDGDTTARVNMGATETMHLVATAGVAPTLQSLINSAGPCESVILAGPGSYPEQLETVGDPVAIIATDGPATTIINADGLGRAINCDEGEPVVTIKGFTLRGNNRVIGRGAVARAANGSTLLLEDCIIQPATAPDGGAVAAISGNIGLINTSIDDCVATNAGGAIYARDAGVSINGASLSRNSAGTTGGAIDAEGCTLQISDCVLKDNQAIGDGGAINALTSLLFIEQSTLSNNNTTGLGGAIRLTGESADSEIRECSFEQNIGLSGGALHVDTLDLDIAETAFFGNEAAMAGGALLVGLDGDVKVAMLFFSGNEAPTAAAAGISGGELEGERITASNNTTNGADGGIVVVAADGILTLINSIIGTPGETSIDVITGTPSLEYCAILGGFPGDGNINADPLFVDPDGADDIIGTADDDCYLMPTSPCINAGTFDLNSAPIAYHDIAGEAPTLYSIDDMGAYEFRCPGDADGDGTVTFDDLNELLEWWGATGVTGAEGDTDRDNDVDFIDLNNLLEDWNVGCLD